MSHTRIVDFETRFEKCKYDPDLATKFTPEEVLTYLQDIAQSNVEQKSYHYSTLFEKFDPQIWLPFIYDLLDNFKLMPQGIPYSYGNAIYSIPNEDGSWSDETYNAYHPGMQLINEAFNCYPEYFTDRLHLLFLNDLSLGRTNDLMLWRKYGHQYVDFFKDYVSKDRTDSELIKTIVKILMVNNEQLDELARQTILKKITTEQSLRILNSDLRAVGMYWNDNALVHLESKKPLHLIFPDNFLKLQSHESFHPATTLPYSYDWGGWRTIVRPSGQKLQLQHLLTLDPIPENLSIKSVKRISFVIDMYMVHDEGAGTFYQHDENGEVILDEEDWSYIQGTKDYVSSEPAFKACKVQVADLGENYLIQGGTYSENNFRIGGKPHFIQDYHYPKCNCCKQKMQFVVQMDNDIPQEDADDFWWGGGGMGYLYWCDNCRVSNISWFCS